MSAAMLVQLTTEDLRALVNDAVADALAERANDNGPALLDQAQLAKAIGVSTRTIFELRKQGLPTVWVCESPRFELAAVLDWLKSRPAPKGAA